MIRQSDSAGGTRNHEENECITDAGRNPSVVQFYECRCMGTGESDRGRGSKKRCGSAGTDPLKQRLYRIPVWYGRHKSVP